MARLHGHSKLQQICTSPAAVQIKMSYVNSFIFFCWNIILIVYVSAFPDKYEVQDTDTNMKFNLLDILNTYTESEKEHRRDSIEDPYENWTGKWMPSHSGEPTPPPKIYHTQNKNNQSHEEKHHKDVTKDPYDNWIGKWMPSHPGEPTPSPKIFHQDNKDNKSHHDNRIPMGVKTLDCDDGKTNLTVDWDHSQIRYTCFGQKIVPDIEILPELYCEPLPQQYVAVHKCMSEPIEYDDDIPLYGTHRPIWPVYGEYKYVPKQRWLHNLEHGGVVMLYHPCANNLEVQRLKTLVKGCLRRHIITPYELLSEDRPLALLTWGCRLTMSHVNDEVVKKFMREHALHGPEFMIFRDGDYNDQLIEKAKIVSDITDSIICSKLM